MQPIIINLLVEEELAEQARARDPFKVVLAISIALLAVVVAVGGLLSGVALRSRVEMQIAAIKWQELEKQQTGGVVGAYRSLKQWADDLVDINQSRRLCAPQLALIKDLVPDDVQLLRLSLVTTAVARAPVAPPAEGLDDVKAKIAQRPPLPAQVVVLQLEGRLASAHPEEDLADFQHNLETNAVFSPQIQSVKLRSYARISVPTERGGRVIGQFVIDCQYKDHP